MSPLRAFWLVPIGIAIWALLVYVALTADVRPASACHNNTSTCVKATPTPRPRVRRTPTPVPTPKPRPFTGYTVFAPPPSYLAPAPGPDPNSYNGCYTAADCRHGTEIIIVIVR